MGGLWPPAWALSLLAAQSAGGEGDPEGRPRVQMLSGAGGGRASVSWGPDALQGQGVVDVSVTGSRCSTGAGCVAISVMGPGPGGLGTI